MPFLNRLVDRVQAIVKKLWNGVKGDSPPRRRANRRHLTPPLTSLPCATPSNVPTMDQRMRAKAMTYPVGRRRKASSTVSLPHTPATTSRRQRPLHAHEHPSLKSKAHSSRTQGPGPKHVDLPRLPRDARPKSKCLPLLPPSKSKRLPSKSKRLPPNPKDLPPIPVESHSQVRNNPGLSSQFREAHHFMIGQQNVNNVQISGTLKTFFEYLKPYVAQGAAHNSDERCDAPKCHPETRVAVQEEIIEWLRHGARADVLKRIMWLSGPAGTGKTAIAGSVAETCRLERLLAASFFFTSHGGSAERCSKRCVITTLASHFAEHEGLPGFKEQLVSAIERNPSIFSRRLGEQAECLILGPFRALCGHPNIDRTSWPTGIVIDGLDEVVAQQYPDSAVHGVEREDEDDQLDILNALFTLSSDPAFPFRILVSSRPERAIQGFFSTVAQESTLRLFLDSKYDPDADIMRYLQAKFASIRCRFDISDPLWPGQAALDRLVEMSSGQFIVPSVIIRWVEGGVPQQRLEEVLRLDKVDVGTKNPFAMLDRLYRHILTRARNPEEDPHLVVKWIVCMTASVRREMPGFPSRSPSARFWRQFLEDFDGELIYRMEPVASLICVSPADASQPVAVYHKSLTDFLYSKARSKDLYVSKAAYESFCAARIAVVLKQKGPAVPLLSPGLDLPGFLREFENLKLLVASTFAARDRICDNFSRFLTLLSEEAKGDLAVCDVAWWTRLLLGKTAWSTRGSSNENETVHYSLLGGIYCGIHKAMGCDSNALEPDLTSARSSTQDPLTERGKETKCRAACVHWRTGILTQAKEQNWCVHEMGRVEVAQLEGVTILEFDQKFKPMLQSHCTVCHPNPSALDA